jgi:hypothetical protein
MDQLFKIVKPVILAIMAVLFITSILEKILVQRPVQKVNSSIATLISYAKNALSCAKHAKSKLTDVWLAKVV